MTLYQIEENISLLPRRDQLLLLERIIHRLRKNAVTEDDNLEKQMKAMAADKEIQQELGIMNEEFAVTEMDGLEKL